MMEAVDNQDYQDRIDAYIRGEMSAPERTTFEEELCTNQDLQKEYQLTLSISKALSDRQDKFKAMRRWDVEANLQKAQKRKRARNWTIGISAAACIAIAALVIRPLMYTGSEVVNPTQEFTLGNSPSSQYRGSNKDINKIESLINEGDYNVALRMCDSISEDLNTKIEALKQDISTSDEEHAQKLEYKVKLNTFELDEVKWKRLEILLATKNYSDALVILEELKDKEGPHKLEADSLYRLMK